MIRAMKNIGVRLWLTLLVSVPSVFFFLPWFSGTWTGPGMMGFFVVLSVLCYGGIGGLMHLAGTWMIQQRIQEAQKWERAGIPSRAEKKYLQAVRIYDSFLLSPAGSRKWMKRITRSLARFALTFDRRSALYNQAVRVCLVSDPHDEALVEMWLKQVQNQGTVTPQDQALMTRLAHVHSGTSRVVPQLARIFLDFGRMDFTARQVYAQVMDAPKLKPGFQQEIERLTGGRAGGEIPLAREPVRQRRQPERKVEPSFSLKRSLPAMTKAVLGAAGKLRRGMAGAGRSAARFMGRVQTGIPGHARWGSWIKAGILAGVFAGMAGFIYHTIFYLKAPEPVTKIETVIQERVPKPFTIQVAAYLTETHARQYVAQLTRRGVDARIKTTTGGGKTWYLIQVSEFQDRQAAAAFGNHLKSENIIEEFFVSNKE